MAVVAAGLLVSGCNTAPADEPAIDAAGFPSVYTPLVAATTQMSNEQAQGQGDILTSVGRPRAAGVVSQAEYRRKRDELSALAANHGTDMQDEISN